MCCHLTVLNFSVCIGAHRTKSDTFPFIRPSSDGMFYGMVMSEYPDLRRESQFPHFSPICHDILS